MSKNTYAYFKKDDIFLHITLDTTQKELVFYYTRNWSPFTKIEPSYLQTWVKALLSAPWKCRKMPKIKAQSARREGRTHIPRNLLQGILSAHIDKFDWSSLNESLPAKIEGFVQKQDKTVDLTFRIKLKELSTLPITLMTSKVFTAGIDMKETQHDTLTFFPIRLLDPHASLPQEPKPYHPDECKSSDESDHLGCSSNSDKERESSEDEKEEVPIKPFHRVQDSNALSHKRIHRKPRQHKPRPTSKTIDESGTTTHTFKLATTKTTS